MDSLVLPFISFRRGQDFHHFPKKAMLSREEKKSSFIRLNLNNNCLYLAGKILTLVGGMHRAFATGGLLIG